MRKIILSCVLFGITTAQAQQLYPNNEFRLWENGCPASWYCNNDVDCTGKVTLADKQKGGAKLQVQHCFDPSKEDRSNNVNLNLDDLSLKLLKGKKVKIILDYSYTPVGGDQAYISVNFEPGDVPVDNYPFFEYNGNKDSFLKAGMNQQLVAWLNFGTADNRLLTAPMNCPDGLLTTTFGIMPAPEATDVHRGTTLVIHRVRLEME